MLPSAEPTARRTGTARSQSALFSLTLMLLTPSFVHTLGLIPRLGRVLATAGHPGTPNVTLNWYTQQLDHFDFREKASWQQRYFTYDTHWAPGGPILFYCGNEASVELYVNATGLMWERAAELGARLVFAEHRYYGASLPLGPASTANASTLRFLTMEQALADYATLIYHLKSQAAADRAHGTVPAVVALGGSYGGMLAAWLRFHYPNAVVGAIAASAPVLAFDGIDAPGSLFDGRKYWEVVSRDASVSPGGSAAGCVEGVGATWPHLFAIGATPAGRAALSSTFRLCGTVRGPEDVTRLAAWLLNVWDTLAMGNFPYPSNYLVFQQTQDPSVTLPAWPFRAACAAFEGATKAMPPAELLARMAIAAGVLYNATHAEKCYELPTDPNFDGIWDYQWCTERLPQETYFGRAGPPTDMFWAVAENRSAVAAHCEKKYGVGAKGSLPWIAASSAFGAQAGSNVLFSNGEYDPWRSGGVLTDLGPSVRALEVAHGAHHLDLFFSNEADPPSVKQAREAEVAAMKAWIHATPWTS